MLIRINHGIFKRCSQPILISCPRLKQTNVCAGDGRVSSMDIYVFTSNLKRKYHLWGQNQLFNLINYGVLKRCCQPILISSPRLKQTNVCAGDRRVNSMEIYVLTYITTINLTSNSVSDSGSPNSPPFEPSSVSVSIFSEFSDCLRVELGMAGFSRRT